MQQKNKYIFLILFQCAIFGIEFIAVKYILVAGYAPFFLLAIRFFIATLALVGFYSIFNIFRSGKVNSFNKKELLYGVIAGIFLFLSFALQTYGAKYTTPAKNGVFTGLYVIFTPIIVMLITKKFTWKPLLIALVSFVGVMVVSNFFAEQLTINIGDFLTILCAITFAAHFILLEKFLTNSNIDFFNFTSIQLLVVAILSCITAFSFEAIEFHNLILDAKVLWLFLFLGIVCTAFSYFIQTVAQSKLTANTVSVVSCSESVFAVIFGIYFGYDQFSLSLIVGTLIIVVSMVLISISNEK
ncbi:permease [Bacteroidia bacterium]|nr:permease [Bacteroidia bacterium]